MGDNSETYERLNRIEQTLVRIDERTARQDQSHSDHERRIRELERDNDKRKGVLAIVGFLGGAIGSTIAWLVKAISGGN